MAQTTDRQTLDKTGTLLTAALGILMALQAFGGRIWPAQYRDPEWIAATFIGNDWLTLLLALPVLLAGLFGARQGQRRGWLLWFGGLGYAIYNYAFYMLGVILNESFLLYILSFIIAGVTAIRGFALLDVRQFADRLSDRLPHRLAGGYLVFVAVGLTAVWLAVWAGHVFTGAELPVEHDAFRLVAVLDLSLMVPALSIGGILLWRKNPVGFVLAPMAAIQGALYLWVLTTNTLIGMQRGLIEPPGELPMWGPLAITTTLAATVLVVRAGSEPKTGTAGG
jgi:hypothetical protein